MSVFFLIFVAINAQWHRNLGIYLILVEHEPYLLTLLVHKILSQSGCSAGVIETLLLGKMEDYSKMSFLFFYGWHTDNYKLKRMFFFYVTDYVQCTTRTIRKMHCHVQSVNHYTSINLNIVMLLKDARTHTRTTACMYIFLISEIKLKTNTYVI